MAFANRVVSHQQLCRDLSKRLCGDQQITPNQTSSFFKQIGILVSHRFAKQKGATPICVEIEKFGSFWRHQAAMPTEFVPDHSLFTLSSDVTVPSNAEKSTVSLSKLAKSCQLSEDQVNLILQGLMVLIAKYQNESLTTLLDLHLSSKEYLVVQQKSVEMMEKQKFRETIAMGTTGLSFVNGQSPKQAQKLRETYGSDLRAKIAELNQSPRLAANEEKEDSERSPSIKPKSETKSVRSVARSLVISTASKAVHPT